MTSVGDVPIVASNVIPLTVSVWTIKKPGTFDAFLPFTVGPLRATRMERRPRANKGDLLTQHLCRMAASILRHDCFRVNLARGPHRWLLTFYLHPKDRLSRRQRARLRNQLFSSLEDVAASINLHVDVHVSIQNEPQVIPNDSAVADIQYIFVAQALFSELETLTAIIREQTNPERVHILCRYALLQSYETAHHMARAINELRRHLEKHSEASAVLRALEDFPKTAHKSVQNLEKSLNRWRDQHAAHRFLEKDGKTSLLIKDMLEGDSLLTPAAVERWYNELTTASREITRFIDQHFLTIYLAHPTSRA
jgi:hypothetical protein